MAIYEITPKGLHAHEPASYAALGIYERNDLQRVLREYISALGEDLLVISEEFSQWEDARRRIDLLAIDKQAKLVVIELKRTDDGGTWSCKHSGMPRWFHRWPTPMSSMPSAISPAPIPTGSRTPPGCYESS